MHRATAGLALWLWGEKSLGAPPHPPPLCVRQMVLRARHSQQRILDTFLRHVEFAMHDTPCCVKISRNKAKLFPNTPRV